ncbi:hypothetical protein [Nocardioides sp. LS1]|uniref:hypothetical protein n=1 Tax=Nocardioides sp. LS1 TaxID=1027620 RepID=UPI000F6189D4|nr:hypothetical protein [Nocardioides sp. LS1]GCD90702.1 hypothetical protein NLS1_27080 [Nocardioides sp. LS1]
MTAIPVTGRPVLVGNRLVLVGSVLYLLEWVAIIAAGIDAPLGADASTAHVTSSYSGVATSWGWAAGWFSVVLLGRVLLVLGIRAALADSGHPQRIMDFAVAAMALSVALEVATYAVTAGGAWYLDHDGSPEVVRGLDAAAVVLNSTVFGPLGVAILCSAGAMWWSGLFPRVLCGVGLVAGVGGTLMGLAAAAPTAGSAADALGIAVPLFWIWMLWTGVLCWRRAIPPDPRAGRAARA